MRTKESMPGPITGANQVKDRVNTYGSSSEHLNLSGSLFMAQVRSDRPENEDLIRGLPTQKVTEDVLVKLSQKHPQNVVRFALEQGLIMVVSA